MPTFVPEDHMLDWHKCQICYPLEIKWLLLLSLLLSSCSVKHSFQIKQHMPKTGGGGELIRSSGNASIKAFLRNHQQNEQSSKRQELNWLPFPKRSSIIPASRYIKALPDKYPNISLPYSRMAWIITRGKPGQQL